MTPHERHTAEGFCPVISLHRSWCCKPAGHTGQHGSPRIPNPDIPVGTYNPRWVSWWD